MVSIKSVIVLFFVTMLCFPLLPTRAGEVSGVTVLKTQELSELRGKEGVILTVSLSPGESSPPHRHNAHTFVYMLEGTVVMQVAGREPVTLERGDTFYEAPEDIHAVSNNTSHSQLARFLVFFVKDKGAPLLLSVK